MIDSIIRQRRTIKPAQMSGKTIPDETILLLLELADWAPNHGRTEPWRFIVYGGEKLKEFCQTHATLYKETTAPEKYKPASFDKLLNAYQGASHLVIVFMQRGSNPNIPEVEEIAAVSAAIQNILLAATAHNLAGFWSTSGLTHDMALIKELGLAAADKVLGLIFIGTTDLPLQEGKRLIPLSEKIKWVH